jgi:hypothetical protein
MVGTKAIAAWHNQQELGNFPPGFELPPNHFMAKVIDIHRADFPPHDATKWMHANRSGIVCRSSDTIPKQHHEHATHLKPPLCTRLIWLKLAELKHVGSSRKAFF